MSVLQEPPPPQTFSPDVPLVAVHGLCFYADCDRAVDLMIESEGLDFSTEAEWERVVLEEGLQCDARCKVHFVTLELDPLPEGQHTINFAGDSLTLQVPGTQRACVGTYPFAANRPSSE